MKLLIERLRSQECNREPFTPEHKDCACRLANEAADALEDWAELFDEVERLRRELGEARGEAKYLRQQLKKLQAVYRIEP